MFGVNRAPIFLMHLHCLQMKRSEIPCFAHHLGVLSGASKIISEPYGTFGANLAPILPRHLHCLQPERSDIPYDHVTKEFYQVHPK
jgi:hypothetical protein